MLELLLSRKRGFVSLAVRPYLVYKSPVTGSTPLRSAGLPTSILRNFRASSRRSEWGNWTGAELRKLFCVQRGWRETNERVATDCIVSERTVNGQPIYQEEIIVENQEDF